MSRKVKLKSLPGKYGLKTFLLLLLSIVIVGSLLAQEPVVPAEKDYQRALAYRRSHFPFSAKRMFKQLIEDYPSHDRALDSEAQLCLLDLDLRHYDKFLEASDSYLLNYSDAPVSDEVAVGRIKALARKGDGQAARNEILLFKANRSESPFMNELPLLELESYYHGEKPENIAQNQEQLNTCQQLVTESLSRAREKKDHHSYEMAIYYGMKIAEAAGQKEAFLSWMDSEKEICPKELRWVLSQKKRQFKGEAMTSKRRPETPAQMMEAAREASLAAKATQNE